MIQNKIAEIIEDWSIINDGRSSDNIAREILAKINEAMDREWEVVSNTDLVLTYCKAWKPVPISHAFSQGIEGMLRFKKIINKNKRNDEKDEQTQ